MLALVLGTTLMAARSSATDAAGTVVCKESYRACGERWLNQAASEQLHGKEQDSTGQQDFGARCYDLVVGRFMGIDPVDFQDGSLYSFNRYAYGTTSW